MTSGLPSLPRLAALGQPEARIKCLARFAHHELMAVELFAWALLRWPDLPPKLRAEFTHALADEQRHCRLYIDRLTQLGGTFFDPPYSNYFWKLVPAISNSRHGPSAFLAGMGLTLEQANLDFTLMYRDAFTKAGDSESAQVLTHVHEDEIRHVALAARWIKVLGPPGTDLIEAYSEAVPFPLSAARAKGKQYHRAARRRAGLGEPFIEFVRNARSNQNDRSGAAAPGARTHQANGQLLLYPNLGGEEIAGKGGTVMTSTTTPTLRLWGLLFGSDARFLPTLAQKNGAEIATALNGAWWPTALCAPSSKPAFSWLEDRGGIVPWISTARLPLHPALDGAKPTTAPAGTVARVHDKAFAHAVAHEENLLPDCLKDRFLVVEPELLHAGDAAIEAMQDKISSWPRELGHNFTLKPRLGTSGRGRVPGVDGRVDCPAVRGALKRLAKRGGAVLEPWFERKHDLSAQIHVSTDGEITLLGTLEQIVAPSGMYLGHRAEIDSRGRVFSGIHHEEVLREAATITSKRAFAEGFHGCCGIDAFSFELPDSDGTKQQILRPLVEFNARFTMGTIVIGLVRRALDNLKTSLDLEPGQRRAFYFGLDAPAAGWSHAYEQVQGPKLLIPLWHPDDEVKPALLFAESRAALDVAVANAHPPNRKRVGANRSRGA